MRRARFARSAGLFTAVFIYCLLLELSPAVDAEVPHIPFTSLENETRGSAAWQADGTGSEAIGQGHLIPNALTPIANSRAYYYMASRDFVDQSSDGALRGNNEPVGLPNFTAALSDGSFTVADLTMTFDLLSLGADVQDQDWSVDGMVETRQYAPVAPVGNVIFYLDGEVLLKGTLPAMIVTIDYNDAADGMDDEISGISDGFRVQNASGESSVAVQGVAAALLSDLGEKRGLRLRWNSLQPAIQVQFSNNGRTGAYFVAPEGRIEVVDLEPLPNQAPAVSISTPSELDVFEDPAVVMIQANAEDTDGTIVKVEFYQDGIKLGEDLEAPYSYTWTDVAAGTYALTAKAIDDAGAESVSDIVNIQVQPAGAMLWELVLNVTNADKAEVAFGIHEAATDFFDAGLDLDASPAPPEDIGSIYFLQNDFYYARDYRAPDSNAEWFLVLDAGADDMIVSWDPTALPTDLALYMLPLDANGQLLAETGVNMKTNTVLEVDMGTASYFLIRQHNTISQEFSITGGWNLISLNVDPLEPQVQHVFQNGVIDGTRTSSQRDSMRGTIYTGSIWGWQRDAADQKLKYFEALEVMPLQGYWIYAATGSNFSVPGEKIAADSTRNIWLNPETGALAMKLHQGWNLCGPEQTLSNPYNDDVLGTIWWWTGQHYEAVSQQHGTMEAGRGYWIYAKTENALLDLTVPAIGSADRTGAHER